MPTNRKRRKRQTAHKPIAQALLDGLPIEETGENRQELVALKYFGVRDYSPGDTELGKRLEGLAHDELQRWAEKS